MAADEHYDYLYSTYIIAEKLKLSSCMNEHETMVEGTFALSNPFQWSQLQLSTELKSSGFIGFVSVCWFMVTIFSAIPASID